MTKLKIYLAGTCGPDELKYREVAKVKYGKQLILFDPFTKIEANITGYTLGEPWTLSNDQITKIVEQDKEAINTCDILVAFINRFTCGTIMEIEHAWNNKIPVYVINPTNELIHDVWLRYHTTKFFLNTIECFKYIIHEVDE